MLKLTYPLIAKYYGKSLRTIKYKADQVGGLKDVGTTYKLLDFYEKKK